jgi:hypothetical protein
MPHADLFLWDIYLVWDLQKLQLRQCLPGFPNLVIIQFVDLLLFCGLLCFSVLGYFGTRDLSRARRLVPLKTWPQVRKKNKISTFFFGNFTCLCFFFSQFLTETGWKGESLRPTDSLIRHRSTMGNACKKFDSFFLFSVL